MNDTMEKVGDYVLEVVCDRIPLNDLVSTRLDRISWARGNGSRSARRKLILAELTAMLVELNNLDVEYIRFIANWCAEVVNVDGE